MPNHVTNIIEIKDNGGVDVSAIRAAFLNEDELVDFNVISPVPACLEGFEPHYGIITLAEAKLNTPINGNILIASLELPNRIKALNAEEEMSDHDKEQVERAISNHKECGFIYWYDWQIAHWGTKWNAYSQPKEGYGIDTKEYIFETAWSHPFVLIEKISKKLPAVTFSIRFADEDTGSNCGSYEIKNGVMQNKDIAPRWSDMTAEQKRKYKQFAFTLRHPDTDPRQYGYDESWEYSEEVEEAWEEEQNRQAQ